MRASYEHPRYICIEGERYIYIETRLVKDVAYGDGVGQKQPASKPCDWRRILYEQKEGGAVFCVVVASNARARRIHHWAFAIVGDKWPCICYTSYIRCCTTCRKGEKEKERFFSPMSIYSPAYAAILFLFLLLFESIYHEAIDLLFGLL